MPPEAGTSASPAVPPTSCPTSASSAGSSRTRAGSTSSADAERAGQSLVTLLVGDLDEWLANLAGRGLAAETVDTIPGAVRKAAFRDPEGNMVTLGQPLTQD